jgi:hypothetical protein
MISQGEMAEDIVIKKLSVKQTHCAKCGEWLEGYEVCPECGHLFYWGNVP